MQPPLPHPTAAWLALAMLCLAAGAAPAGAPVIQPGPWKLTPDHLPQSSVPNGRLEGPFEFHSAVFAGTVRRYWLFVPAQYTAAEPAGVLVFQDGQRATNPDGPLRVPQVMENLIARGDMPVSIGIFITPGNLSEHYPDNLGMGNPDHRAEEYDSLADDYARFLIGELLPKVGETYLLSDDPERYAIGGTSSGAICAFTVAWRRPDVFRKVISFIGSYTSIGFRPDAEPVRLGGQDYPALIRREPLRPIRIFMQDGSQDLDNEWGAWFLANQQMAAAFRYANRIADVNDKGRPRYAVRTVWTAGTHSDEDGGSMLPDAIRWLWSGEP